MSNLGSILWLIPALPLAAAVVTAALAFTNRRELKQQAHWPCIVAVVASCVLSFIVLFSLPMAPPEKGGAEPGAEREAAQEVHGGPPVVKSYYTWFKAGDVDVGFTLRADNLTAFMLVTVTFVGSLIVIYSAGYMHGDEGYPRFFAEVALFVFSMTGLVLADNFLLLYAFWEGVGLCSYLLIGFWFTKPSAADAARKAFLVTRLGDVGLFLGILLLWVGFSIGPEPSLNLHTLDYQRIFANAAHAEGPIHTRVTIACLLIFCGAVGKSAQFPLYVWLPDAMEGPTPVSALIHAATMVTAGVYLVARCTPLFSQSPVAQMVVASIGGFTAILAALIALTQTDLKRVLAYSTISQLGYMFLAVGSGAAVAGIFHLFTHAFFKALLFLAAGSVMHAMGGVIDMRKFSGLKRLMPITHWTFLCGAAALSAVPFITSGFWSKEEILSGVLQAGQAGGTVPGLVYGVLLAVGVITGGLTAFYTFRAYFLTFWGEERIPHEAGHHAHESPPVMWVPLVVLATGALLVGFLNAEPLTSFVSSYLRATPDLAGARLPAEGGWSVLSAAVWLASMVLALGGIALAWWVYVREPGLARKVVAAVPGLYEASRNKFYVDELYDLFLLTPLRWFTALCRWLDARVVDGVVDLVGQVPAMLGYLFRPVQNGLVQFYALAMILGLTVFLLALVRAL